MNPNLPSDYHEQITCSNCAHAHHYLDWDRGDGWPAYACNLDKSMPPEPEERSIHLSGPLGAWIETHSVDAHGVCSQHWTRCEVVLTFAEGSPTTLPDSPETRMLARHRLVQGQPTDMQIRNVGMGNRPRYVFTWSRDAARAGVFLYTVPIVSDLDRRVPTGIELKDRWMP